MLDTLRARWRRIGPWPRRLAALTCLLLAALTAARSPTRSPSSGQGADPLALQPMQVAIPVPITGDVSGVVPGDAVGVLAAPDAGGFDARAPNARLVADHLHVIAIRDAASGFSDDSPAVVTLAVTRRVGLELAEYVTQPLFLILDGPPRV